MPVERDRIEYLFTRNPSFCVMPWLQVHASVDGALGRCCADKSVWHGFYYKSRQRPEFILNSMAYGCVDGSAFAASCPDRVLGMAQAFNSKQAKMTRVSMLSGRKLKCCADCYRHEETGSTSLRLYFNNRYRRNFDWKEIIDGTSSDGFAPRGPFILDLRLGNHCRLRCTMCSYPLSSARRNQHSPEWTRPVIDPYFENRPFLDEIRSMAPGLREISFSGGEPFLQPAHDHLVETLPEDTGLFYISSLVYFPDKLAERLSVFKRVEIEASCDGTGALFEQIRKGASWSAFCTNLEKARRVSAVRLAVTVQRDNVRHIGKIVSWAGDNSLDVSLRNILLFPGHLRVEKLPAPERTKCVDELGMLAMSLRERGKNETAEEIERIIGRLK